MLICNIEVTDISFLYHLFQGHGSYSEMLMQELFSTIVVIGLYTGDV